MALQNYGNVVWTGFSGFVQKSPCFFPFLANKKAELALKEKEAALLKLAQMQKEVDNLSGGPLLHVIRRVQDLKTAPMGALKTIEWQLRKDLQEVEKVISFLFLIKGSLISEIFSHCLFLQKKFLSNHYPELFKLK